MGSNDLYEIRDLVMIGILKAKSVLRASVRRRGDVHKFISIYFGTIQAENLVHYQLINLWTSPFPA